MQRYNLKFLLLGGSQTGKSTTLDTLRGYVKCNDFMMMEQKQWYIGGKIVNGIIQDLQDMDLMSSMVVPFVKDSAILFFFYDPDREDTIDFLEDWMKKNFRYIPASSTMYVVSTQKKKRSVRASELHSVYFCCKHVSVDITDEDDVKMLFEGSARDIMQYAKETKKESMPGLRRQKERQSYCMWW